MLRLAAELESWRPSASWVFSSAWRFCVFLCVVVDVRCALCSGQEEKQHRGNLDGRERPARIDKRPKRGMQRMTVVHQLFPRCDQRTIAAFCVVVRLRVVYMAKSLHQFSCF